MLGRKDWSIAEDRLVKLGESEMEMFRFLKDRPAGAILTTDTDIMLARLLAMDELVEFSMDDNKAIISAELRDAYRELWADEQTLQWRKYNWMYKCIEAGKYLYGVMNMDVLSQLFALRYPHAETDEIKKLFDTTPVSYQWFSAKESDNEHGELLVLNGFEQGNYYLKLEEQVKDVPFYIPTKDEVEELYNNGCLISREAHAAMQDYIIEKFGVEKDAAILKIHDLYEDINNRVRMSDAVDKFASEEGYAFASDEDQFKFVEKYINLSQECRIRDNRGHDYFEMVGIMAGKNKKSAAGAKSAPIKKVKIGRNEPCPCGSGKKYKNCCGKNA